MVVSTDTITITNVIIISIAFSLHLHRILIASLSHLYPTVVLKITHFFFIVHWTTTHIHHISPFSRWGLQMTNERDSFLIQISVSADFDPGLAGPNCKTHPMPIHRQSNVDFNKHVQKGG